MYGALSLLLGVATSMHQSTKSPLAGGVQRLSSLPALDTDCWPVAWAALRWERPLYRRRNRYLQWAQSPPGCSGQDATLAQSVWGIVVLAVAKPKGEKEQQSLATSNPRDTTGIWPRVRSCDGIGFALRSQCSP
ncbi:hypothetical protein BDP55DRAFT_633001 [Colletotrichum godetiae]|uniref:Uncharacterized protein n=1 Tax=Colletotrichum godetiae TaxID=1209918 RepID=A0AAJ0EWU0_9PEZI|nr:uncharacterized protein BDP55DRAFT_633001 [Colletotrichum godetiae]KAK1674559.1 hypothetical protein BDP55DRAFT_633001 [Colletotrichum godetiae]